MGKKSRESEPSLDDTRWRPVREEYKLISDLTGHPQLALVDLNEALANGRVRFMRRHLRTGKREQLSSKFWLDNVLHVWWYQSNLFVSLWHPSRPGHVDPIDDFELFVWHPDVASVWPARREADHEVTPLREAVHEMTPLRAKPGTKPTGDWHTLIAQWLIAVAVDEPKRLRNVDVLVAEASAFLLDEIKWAPAEAKDLRKKIVELLRLVSR
jgi:hypothetical protein